MSKQRRQCGEHGDGVSEDGDQVGADLEMTELVVALMEIWCVPSSIRDGTRFAPSILQSRCLGGLLAFHRQWMNGISLMCRRFRCSLFDFHTHIGQYRFQGTQAQHDVFYPA